MYIKLQTTRTVIT